MQGATISFLHRDHLATVKMVTNMAGTVTESTGYAAFGEPKPATSLPKGFIGERPDVETGMLYLNARYYDPVLGRLSRRMTGTRLWRGWGRIGMLMR